MTDAGSGQPCSPRQEDQSALKRKETLIQSVTWMSLEDRQEGKRPDSKDPAHLLDTLGASRQDGVTAMLGAEREVDIRGMDFRNSEAGRDKVVSNAFECL